MKKIYFSILVSSLLYVSSFAQTVIPTTDELILPRFAYWGGANGLGRIQYASRLKLTGLLPNATYKYYVGLSNITTGTNEPGMFFNIKNTATSAGNIIGLGFSRSFNTEVVNDVVSSSVHAAFTTDANGDYTGWFATSAIGNAKHPINGDVYLYVHLNDGGTGTSIAKTYRTTSTIKLLDYVTTSAGITGLIGSATGIGSEKFVILYDDKTTSQRPLYATWTENDGLNTSTQFTGWYQSINGISDAWAALIPNDLASGVRSIEYLNIDGTSAGPARTSTNGIFGAVSTVNPNLGSTSTAINLDPSVLPITLTDFTSVAKDFSVALNWKTSTEINNQYFEVLRAGEDGKFTVIGKINGALNSSESKNYTFTDYNPLIGNNYYQLKQVDVDSKSTSFGPVIVKFGLSTNIFKLSNSSETSVSINISSSEEKQAEIAYIGLDGKILHKQSVILQNGINTVVIPVHKSTGSIGIISCKVGAEQKTLKIAR